MKIREVLFIDVPHVIDILLSVFHEEIWCLVWWKEPPSLATGDIGRPGVGRVDIAMKGSESSLSTHVHKPEIIIGMSNVVRIHPVITKDIGGRVKRGVGIYNRVNVNCFKLLRKMPIFERASLAGFPQLKF